MNISSLFERKQFRSALLTVQLGFCIVGTFNLSASAFGSTVWCDTSSTMTEVYSENCFTSTSGWVKSGIDSGPEYGLDTSSLDDVDVATSGCALQVIVRPTVQGRTRILGWNNPAAIMAGTVDENHFVRGKFYISASNPVTDSLNKVPNFRLRLSQGNVAMSEMQFEYASTGLSNVPHEPLYDYFNDPERETSAGIYLAPSRNDYYPSLYRVDFDPVECPNSDTQDIGALFESYASQNTADGTLNLQEVVLGVYPKLSETSCSKVFEYDRAEGLSGGVGGPKSLGASIFNMEPDYQPGRLQDLYLTPSSQMATVSESTDGLVIDTLPAGKIVFSKALVTMKSTSNTLTPRINPDKIYMARFYATSSVPTYSSDPNTTRQSSLAFRIETAHGAVKSFMQLAGPINASDPNAAFGRQVLPGIGCDNEDTSSSLDTDLITPGEDGGWYTALLSTPLDPDIRADVSGDMGLFASAPGFGSSQPSARDISLGVDVLGMPRNWKLAPSFTATNFMDANRAHVRVSRIELHEFCQIEDGGYDY